VDAGSLKRILMQHTFSTFHKLREAGLGCNR
jgi:hypothetical protein